MQRFFRVTLLSSVVLARAASAAIVGPSHYIVGSLSLPGPAQGDVSVVGTSLLVGQGSFGAGSETIARRDWNGTITTLATGFNSLSNFAVSNDRTLLFATDNGGDLGGAVTGDTVFAIDDPRIATMPVAAAGHEVAAAGSIPFAQGLAVAPDGEPYASNAAGGTSGSVLRHRSFGFPPFVTHATGFGYTAGLAFNGDGHLFVGDVDSNTFAGRVVELDAGGNFVRTLAGNLSGALDLAFDRDGRLLVSGGFVPDFSSSTIIAIDADGNVSEFAHGFGFSSGLDVDAISGRVYALDFGSSSVTTFTPIDALLPGGGRRSNDCMAEFSDLTPALNRRGLPALKMICQDGSACDRDATADGVCTFALGVCFNVPGDPLCNSAGVDDFAVAPIGGVTDPQLAALENLANAS